MDIYWVGDAGAWSDAANHWATSSGGTPDAGNLPGSGDNVFFDSNSGTGTVNVDSSVSITDYTNSSADIIISPGNNDMSVSGNWNHGASSVFDPGTGTVYLTGSGSQSISTGLSGPGSSGAFYNLTQSGSGTSTLSVTEDLTVNNTMTSNAGVFDCGYRSLFLNGAGNPLVISGGTLYTQNAEVHYRGDGATTITSTSYLALWVGDGEVQTTARTYTLGGDVTVNHFVSIGSGNGYIQSLDPSTYTITLTGIVDDPVNPLFRVNSYGNFIPSTSTIAANVASGNRVLCAGTDFYNVTIGTGSGSLSLNGANSFNDLTVSPPMIFGFEDGYTNTINGVFTAVGTPGNYITIVRGTLSKPSGDRVCCDYLDIRDNTVTGVDWFAGSHSLDDGVNVGWIFQGCSSPGPSNTGNFFLCFNQ